MLSKEECKKTLNKDGITYTDEEVKEIREFLYVLAEIDYRIFRRKMEKEKATETKVVQLNANQNTQTNDTESSSLHPGIYRRAS